MSLPSVGWLTSFGPSFGPTVRVKLLQLNGLYGCLITRKESIVPFFCHPLSIFFFPSSRVPRTLPRVLMEFLLLPGALRHPSLVPFSSLFFLLFLLVVILLLVLITVCFFSFLRRTLAVFQTPVLSV